MNFGSIRAFLLSSYPVHMSQVGMHLCATAKVKGRIQLKIEQTLPKHLSSYFKFRSSISLPEKVPPGLWGYVIIRNPHASTWTRFILLGPTVNTK